VKPLVEVNVAPHDQLLPAVALAVVGFALVMGIEWVASRKK
jgi:hypothetical protein